MMEYVYLVKNGNIFEKRMIAGDHGVVMSQPLEGRVGSGSKQLCLSDDGKWCGIAGGYKEAYFYLIDTVKQKQFKLESELLGESYAPCFIGGGSKQIAIGGIKEFEIWDIETRTSVHH